MCQLDLDLGHPTVRTAAERVIRWFNEDVATSAGTVLVLSGDVGCGKTHIAMKVAACFGPAARFVTETQLLTQIKDSYDRWDVREEEIIARVNRSALLVLDDVGVTHVKELAWLQEKYWAFVDGRHEVGLCALMTTNLKATSFWSRLGSRAASRIVGARGTHGGFVDMFGVPDFRKYGGGHE